MLWARRRRALSASSLRARTLEDGSIGASMLLARARIGKQVSDALPVKDEQPLWSLYRERARWSRGKPRPATCMQRRIDDMRFSSILGVAFVCVALPMFGCASMQKLGTAA